MQSEIAVEIVGLSKSYKKGKNTVQVLSNVNLKVKRGEFLAIVGPSGRGKTTLLNMMGGLDSCTEGKIDILGVNISNLDNDELSGWRAKNIGIIFQFYNLMPTLTAAENVELPLLLTRLNKDARARNVKAALDVVGMSERADHYPSELSGGQEQRVAIARAIVSAPSLLLADEPTGDLDRKTATEIMEILKYLNESMNKTIIMVTHDTAAKGYASAVLDLEVDDITKSDFTSAAR